MKKLSTLMGVAFFALMIVGCEGPQGTAGADGAAGAAGADGADGINAAETCTDCHVNDTKLFSRQVQYDASVHRNGVEGELGGSVPTDYQSGGVDQEFTSVWSWHGRYYTVQPV